MDMNTVMMLRRNRNPATPSANRIALRVRYQERGRGGSSAYSDLLARQDDRAEDGDQNQNGGDFERQQVVGEQAAADVGGVPPCEAAEDAPSSVRGRDA